GPIRAVRGNISSTIANNGPHLIDTVLFLLGDPQIREVTCQCRRSSEGFNRGYPAEDGAAGEIVFEDGVRCHLLTGDLSPNFFSIKIEAERGEIEVSPKLLKVRGVQLAAAPTNGDFLAGQFVDFVRWVKGKRLPNNFRAASRTTPEVVLGLYEAARTKTAVA